MSTSDTPLPQYMPTMKGATLKNLMDYAFQRKRELNRDVAFLVRPGSIPKKSWLALEGPNSYETAGANLYRNSGDQPDDVDDYCVFLTYEPTEMCMGLAWRAHTKRVYWKTDPRGETFCRQAFPHPYPEPIPVSYDDLLGNWNDPVFIHGGNYNPDAALGRKLDVGLRHGIQPLTRDPRYEDSAYMKVVSALVGSAWNEERPRAERPGVEGRRPYGNNIGGIFVDWPSGRITGWGLNMKHLNKCYHGETLMLLHYLKSRDRDSLPEGSTLYTSLEPCHMCSGFIATVGRNIRVVSGQPDEGACDRSALRREVAGCRLLGHDMPDPITLEHARGEQAMIPFLFSDASADHFRERSDGPSRNMLMGRHTGEHPFLQEGFDLLEALRRRGLIRGTAFADRRRGYYQRVRGRLVDHLEAGDFA